MSLSKSAKEYLIVALANKKIGEEVAAAIDSSGSGPAASISAITPSDMTAIAATYADLAAARASVNTLRTDAEARLDAVEAKLNSVIAALKAAGLMSV
jgi:uncharacterized protein YggE